MKRLNEIHTAIIMVMLPGVIVNATIRQSWIDVGIAALLCAYLFFKSAVELDETKLAALDDIEQKFRIMNGKLELHHDQMEDVSKTAQEMKSALNSMKLGNAFARK